MIRYKKYMVRHALSTKIRVVPNAILLVRKAPVMKALKNVASLQRKRLFEEVAEELRKPILSGYYQVGDKLPSEGELAKLFQVSRSVIREAMLYLEMSGLVKVKQGGTGGAFVSEMNPQIVQTFMRDLLGSGRASLGQLAEVRMYLDPEVSRLAAIRATEKDLQELEESLRLLLSLTPVIEKLRCISEFHKILGRASHNLFYAIITDSITDLTTDLTAEFVNSLSREELHQIHSEHEAIYKAVAAGDSEQAGSLTGEHTRWMTRRMLQREKIYLERIKNGSGSTV